MTDDLDLRNAELLRVVEMLDRHEACILTGAGISTESGIPDYRGPERAGRPVKPMSWREFVSSSEARRRYWARSAIGWPWMAARQPNAGHRVVAALERSGICSGLITQNVDGLHRAAGSRRIVELHGALRSVVCLECGRRESRDLYQERILLQNPGWDELGGDVRPDGDVALDEAKEGAFAVPACLACGGTVKPDIVFFGDSVPRERVDAAFAMLERAEWLLVLGSSLTVYSGYRFVAAADKAKKPVVVINDGTTRGDAQATLAIPARLGEALTFIASNLELV